MLCYFKKYKIEIIIILIFIFSIYIQKRAISYSCLVAFLIKANENKRLVSLLRLSIYSLFLFSSLIVFAFGFKKDSSLGRLLIYKISSRILAENWLTGIGFMRFKHEYLLYQASYFKNEHYTSKDLLLADNTYFAFNDYLQLWIELGILVPITTFIFFFFLYYFYLLKRRYCRLTTLYIDVSYYGIIIVCVSAIFTHIFENLIVEIFLTTAVSILIISSIATKRSYFQIYILLSLSIQIALFAPQFIKAIYSYKYSSKLKELQETFLMGYKGQTLIECDKLYPYLNHMPEFLSLFAQASASMGDTKRAVSLTEQIIRLRKSNTAYLQLAQLKSKLKDPSAEFYYNLSIYMVPNRLINREALLNYYMIEKRYAKARMVSQELLKIPIKIESEESNAIVKRVQFLNRKLSSYNLPH